MARGPNDRNFQADIPNALWEQYEAWAEGRGKIYNRQLLTALFRLFVNAPESVKRAALNGTDDEITASIATADAPHRQAHEATPDEAEGFQLLKKVTRFMGPEAKRALTPDEAATLEAFLKRKELEAARNADMTADAVERDIEDEKRKLGGT